MINYEMALSEIEMYKKAHESLSENLTDANKKAQQYKAERDTLIDDIAVLRANNKRLERENEQLSDYKAKYIISKAHIRDLQSQTKSENEHLKRKALGYDKMMTGKMGELYKKAEAFDEILTILNMDEEYKDAIGDYE